MVATVAAMQICADSAGVEAWLKQLPADAGAAFSALRQQAHALVSGTVTGPERYRMLEKMRLRAIALAGEQRCLYQGKALPLAPEEQAAWGDQIGFWQACYFGYALCADAGLESQVAAAIWQRALDSLGRAMREHIVSYRTIPISLWKELNRCYLSAQECALGAVEVADPVRPGAPTSCKAAYLCTVLYEAANLYSVSATQMQMLDDWLPDWLALVDLRDCAPAATSRSPLVIDLAGDHGARLARDAAPAKTLRYLDTGALALKLRDLAATIRNGALPQGSDTSQSLPRAALERLLTHLYVQWCSAGTGRIDDRRDALKRAQVAINMHAIHFQISGRAFKQPGLRYTREEEHDLATFGHITERTQMRLLTSGSSAMESWDIVNQSSSGSVGMCRKPGLESRITHGQLIAMRTSSIDAPVLAMVQRLKLDQDGVLHIGVRVLPGEAHGVAVRPKGDPSLKYERALLLDADPERNTPSVLIVPPGRFAPGAALELYTARPESITVTEIIEHYADHDRASFAASGQAAR